MAKYSRTWLTLVLVAVVFSTAVGGGSALIIVSPRLTQGVLTQTPANPRVQTVQF